MRSGTLGISRGHQLGQPFVPTPRLALVPREVEPKRSRSRKSSTSASSTSSSTSKALAIIREEAPPPPTSTPVQPVPATPEYQFVHDRLTALERLARLRDLGIITLEEFAKEKALVLNPAAEELVLQEPLTVIGPQRPPAAKPVVSARPPGDDPLIKQLFSWQFLPVG